MKCTIPGRGVKTFGKTLHCLAKIGDELYVDALPNGLVLKTVNSARSAFACFLFRRAFFHSYSDGRGREDEDEETLKCKISIKSCVSVFRALSTLEKTVDHCRIHLDLKDCKLVFVFHCRHGIIKTHNLGFQECEALEVVFTKELCPNQIASPAKVLSEVVTNFPNNQEEITVIAEPGRIRVKNYIEDDSVDSDRVPQTEISLMPAEFDEYQIGLDSSITFCLRELKAILLFTDAIPHSLSVRFETAGKPVVFSIDDNPEYQADFVLSTIPEPSTTSAAHSTTQKATDKSQTTRNDKSQGGRRNGSHTEEDIVGQESILQDISDFHMPPATAAIGGTKARKNRETDQQSSTVTVHARTTAHVPSPPQDCSLMDTEPREVLRGLSGAGREQEYDPVDVLFEVENQNDVAEDGNVFGFDPKAPKKGKGRKGKDKAGPEPLKPSISRFPDDDDFFDDDFPYKDMFVKTTTQSEPTSHSSGRVCSQRPSGDQEMEDPDMTQADFTPDSLINDSAFIPTTPPSKKFKSSLFGVDMFPSHHNKSEVLAPDSDEESTGE